MENAMRERVMEAVPSMVAGALLLLLANTGASGTPPPDFSLRDTGGNVHSPRDWKSKRAVVLVFVTVDCPITNSYVPELNRINAEYAPRGIEVFAVQGDASQNAENLRAYAKEYAYSFPLLLDPNLTMAKWTGATTMPEVAVLSPSGEVLYLGRIDDRYVDFGKQRPQAKQHDLRNALDALLSGKPVPEARTRALGCAISAKAI
jgi:peroxiredoxin